MAESDQPLLNRAGSRFMRNPDESPVSYSRRVLASVSSFKNEDFDFSIPFPSRSSPANQDGTSPKSHSEIQQLQSHLQQVYPKRLLFLEKEEILNFASSKGMNLLALFARHRVPPVLILFIFTIPATIVYLVYKLFTRFPNETIMLLAAFFFVTICLLSRFAPGFLQNWFLSKHEDIRKRCFQLPPLPLFVTKNRESRH